MEISLPGVRIRLGLGLELGLGLGLTDRMHALARIGSKLTCLLYTSDAADE